ncbi:tetratricopeptide repeat protein [Scytonema tolypothrichoides VB-61278]|nr:tetratricopeptide repeat protein [Scytonema tolypothrichoides VB-61278]
MSTYHFNFLIEILQATADSKGNPQVVYPLLARNINLLDDVLAEILVYWGTNTLREADADRAESIAVVIGDFSNLIQQFPWGNKASNIEIAITGYEVALTFYTPQAFPQQWARAKCGSGNAYSDRIRGDIAENLELAIAAYQEALTVYTFDAFPQDWAMTKNNLANAYRNRIRGDIAENLEQAIVCFQEALKVITVDSFPQGWAMMQNNLAIAYRQRIRGDIAENVERAIALFQESLRVYTIDAFPQDWAQTQNYLAIAFFYRIRGDIAENLEQAIICFQNALRVYTFDTFPKAWAMTKNHLANAYSRRIRGNIAENLDWAIDYYQEALRVRTFDDFPQDWAQTQNNLANAYSNRIRGDIAENLELAIACFQNALRVYTIDAFPQDWARTQNNLALAYSNRIREERAENLELAITCFQKALRVYTFDAFPQDWAMTQNHLTTAYIERIRGERAKNLELAIAASRDALRVYTRKAFPQNWARTQNNLGNAYSTRIRGEQAENLELAIACFQDVLKVYTFDDFPEKWAQTKFNLGNAYSNRIKGERAENLELAIACFEDALKVYTFDDFRQKWAATKNSLATAYSSRIRGERAENLELAIAYYQEALQVRTFDAFPQDWAMTQLNLASTYINRISEERVENLELAIAASSVALKVYTREAFPEDHAKTLFGLGVSYQNTNQLTSAYTTFKSAIETVESLRSEILSRDETKRKHAEQWNRIYINMVEVCLELDNINEAIEYVERSKNRNLVELILDRDFKTIFPPEVANQLEQLRDQIASGQYEIQNSKAENPKLLARNLQQLRQKRQELQDCYLPVGYGFRFEQFQSTLAQHTAIIEWYITNQKFLAFVVKPNGQELRVWQSQPEDLKLLSNWVNEYLQDYNKTGKNQWRDKLEKRLKQLSEILHLESILDQIPAHCDRLILIPHRFLHLLPLHALPVGDSYLLDRFSQGVSYAPSCQLLQEVQQRERPDFQSLFAIQNPTGDLQFTDQEVKSILSFFPSHQVLSNSHATKTALDQALPHLQEVDYLHFSCHGHFKTDSPLDSFLLLADAQVSSIPRDADPKQYFETSKGIIDLSKCLTLGNLFEQDFDFKKCRLVVLSACETGLIDIDNNSDEYIGLPSGFLYAGSSSVVSSLWTVDDRSTAYLMIKFLQNLKAAFDGSEYISVAMALKQAQDWLRNLTWEDLNKWANHLQLDSSNNREIELKIQHSIRQIVAKINLDNKIGEKPFQSPYYWAGFTAIGK